MPPVADLHRPRNAKRPRPGEPGGVEPLDWLHTTSPARWRTTQGELSYRWLQDWGADPFEGYELVLGEH